ncbi:Calx-beta domain-containing protein, partial [Roseovarius sp. D22-M7]|uniref:Calx-beta domain-containing protein n=1 Tax=Roseovarius sp. D22-M7 TaxID=3127116 RepID=UPI0030105A6B
LNINPSTIDGSEIDENFTVEFFDPTNAVLAGGLPRLVTNGTILEGSGVSLFVIPTYAFENSGEAVFAVHLSRPLENDITLSYSTSDGTAVAGDDYTATSGTVTFLAGQTEAAVRVPILSDALDEPDETFALTFVPTTEIANGSDGATAIGTIVEGGPIVEPVATVSLSVSPASAPEGDSGPQTAVTFTLSRSGDLTNAVTATLMAGGSAAAGSDYTGAIPASLTIPAGASEASFTVTVQGDEDVEGDEEITVTIDGLDRGDHGIGTASATHTIEEEPGEGGSAPVAADDAFTTDEDTALAGDLFADNGAGPDSDADGDSFSVTAASVGGVALTLGVATELAGGGRLTVGSDGSLAFDPDGDFEALGTGETATVEISYTIADDDGSDDATATISIAGVNDAPGITSGAAFTVPENQTAIGSVVATDPEGDTLTYAITGGADAALFDIDTATGALSFLTAPDFESPADTGGDNVYDLAVAASDGTDSTPQDITVTVTDVEPEPDAATVSLSVSPVSAPEGDSGPQTAVTFTLSRSGDLTNAVTATLMAGGSAAAGSDYTGAIPASLTIPAGASEASFTVTVQGDEDVEGDEEITVTIDGLDRADHGIGTASATHTIEEDPDEGDVPPVAADDAFTTDEDTALAGDLFADNGAGPDSDADGDPFTLTAASVGGVALTLGVATELAGGGRLTVGSDGSLAFDPDGDFEALGTGETATVEISYTIADDDGSDDATATISIAGVNDAPGITSGAAFTVPENQTAIGSVVATDPEGDTLTYAITGGADAALFDIDTATGALSFLTAPDFESPADTGGDNVYDLAVAASDGTDSTPQDITVTVTDVEPEGPEPELIVGTTGIDYLVGTDADERIEGRGGPLDQVIGGGGADVFVFEDQVGSRDVLAIRDFSQAEGDMLDLQGAEIAQEVVAGGSTYLILAGEDRDLIILDGVMGYDDLLLT